MMKNKKINVQGIDIVISQIVNQDYICITDIAKTKDGESRAADIIKNWIRNRGTLEYLGTWEQLYNPIFKVVEFDHFKTEESNRLNLSWNFQRLAKINYKIHPDAIKEKA